MKLKTTWRIGGIICLFVMMVVGPVRFTYASHLGQNMLGQQPDNPNQPADSLCAFSWVESNDDGSTRIPPGFTAVIDPGDNGNDPNEPQDAGAVSGRYSGNVASTTATYTSNTIAFSLTNAYPGYYPTVFFGIINEWGTPGIVESITVEKPESVDVTVRGIAQNQIIESGTAVVGSLAVRVGDSVSQGQAYIFKVTIRVVQWSGSDFEPPPDGGGGGEPPPAPTPPPPAPPPPPPTVPIEPEGTVTGAEYQLQITPPNDIVVNTDPGLNSAGNVNLGTPTISPQDIICVISNDAPLIFPVGTTFVTWTVADTRGNTASAVQMVTVIKGEYYLDIDFLGKVERVTVNSNNHSVVGTQILSDPNNQNNLEIESGTVVVCRDQSDVAWYPELIVIKEAELSITVPDGMAMLGPLYTVTGYKNRNSLDTTSSQTDFNPPVTVILTYDPENLPLGALSVFVASPDVARSVWVKLPTAVGMVAEVGKVNGLIIGQSSFGAMVEIPLSGFSVSNLSIVPNIKKIGIGGIVFVKKIGESINIAADLTNNGDQESASRIYIKVDSYIKSTTEVSLGPQNSERVVFTIAGNKPGQHVVQIGDSSGEFLTRTWINWWLIGGLSSGVLIIICWAVWRRLYRHRQQRMT